MRKSEVREMPSLPRGGGDDLVRDEQVSSRRVRLVAAFRFSACFFALISQLYCAELCLQPLVAMALNSMPTHVFSKTLPACLCVHNGAYFHRFSLVF